MSRWIAALRSKLTSLGELYDRWASAKPPSGCCITGVALQLEERAEAERRANLTSDRR